MVFFMIYNVHLELEKYDIFFLINIIINEYSVSRIQVHQVDVDVIHTLLIMSF